MQEAKVTGVIHLVEPTKTYGAKGFQKRLIVLEQEDGRFPNFVPVELTQRNCEMGDRFKVGEEVEVTYTLKGRRWEKDRDEVRFFLNAEVIDIRKLGAAGGKDRDGRYEPPPPADDGYDDEVPF